MTKEMPDITWAYLTRPDYETVRAKGCFVDGDTVICERMLHKGRRLLKEAELWLRLLEVDTPELRSPTLEAGLAAAAFTRSWIEDAERRMDGYWPLILQDIKTDSFGRVLCYVWARDTGESLNEAILAAGHSPRISALQQLRDA